MGMCFDGSGGNALPVAFSQTQPNGRSVYSVSFLAGTAGHRPFPRDELWRQVELFDGVASPHVVTPPRRLLNIAPRRRSASLEAVLRHPSRLGDNATFQALVGAGYYDRTGGRPADVGTVAILWVDGPYKFDASLDRLGNSAVLLIVRFENIAEHPLFVAG